MAAVRVLNKIAPAVFKLLVSLKNVCRIGIPRWNKYMSALGKVFASELGRKPRMFPSAAEADDYNSLVATFGRHSHVIDLVDKNG